jgi:hypothetical protein
MSGTSEDRSESADDEDHYAVAGPFCLKISDTRHYEWSPKDGWKVGVHSKAALESPTSGG